jgi:hypothetical protein
VTVLAPEALADEMHYETGTPVIAAPGVEACGYRITRGIVGELQRRGFDTVIVAGEGNRRAELLALLSGAGRKVELREDGAAHVFWAAPYKPLVLAVQLAVGVVEKLTLSFVLGIVWGSLALEGCVSKLLRRRAAAGAG